MKIFVLNWKNIVAFIFVGLLTIKNELKIFLQRSNNDQLHPVQNTWKTKYKCTVKLEIQRYKDSTNGKW